MLLRTTAAKLEKLRGAEPGAIPPWVSQVRVRVRLGLGLGLGLG